MNRLLLNTHGSKAVRYLSYPVIFGMILSLVVFVQILAATEVTTASVAGATIRGVVTNSQHEPLVGMQIAAMNYITDGVGGGYVASAFWGQSNELGQYQITGLPAGNYRIEFRDITSPPRYVHRFYMNAATLERATDVAIVENAVLDHIDMQLPAVSRLHGRITDSSGQPITDATARLYVHDPSGWSKGNDLLVDAQGYYTWTGLYPYTYRIGFETSYLSTPRYQQQFYNNVENFDAATDLVLGLEQTISNVDGKLLPLPHQIAGWVRNEQGEPLANVRVWLWRQDTDAEQKWVQMGETWTNPTGGYTFTDLTPGAYRLGFVDLNPPQRYASEYYNDVDELAAATTLTLTAGHSFTEINAVLGEKSHITGRVRNPQGQPLDDIGVNAYRFTTESQPTGSWLQVESVRTNENGNYDISHLEQGLYRLEFLESPSRYLYLDEFYDNVYTVDEAKTIPVPRSSTVANINGVLTTGGTISGRVTNGAGQVVQDVIVSAWQQRVNSAGDLVWEEVGRGGSSDTNGRYLITRLKPGAYRVFFDDFNWRRYAPEYYDNAPQIDIAQDVIVHADQETPNIDAQLAKSAGIQGQVTEGTGKPAAGVTIGAYRFVSDTTGGFWQPILYTESDAAGSYRLGGLLPGPYRVGFAVTDFTLTGSYVTEYYNNAPTLAAAQTITIAAGQIRTGVDAKLDRRPSLAGLVTGPTSAPLSNITAALFYSATSPVGEKYVINAGMTATDEQGNYRFDDIFVGAYTVCFSDSNTPPLWRGACYKNERTLTHATWVTATANAKITGINAHLISAETNTAPIVNDDTLTVFRGSSTAMLSSGASSLLTNDHDNEGDPFGASIATQPAHGTLSLDYEGHFLYTHSGDDTKRDYFTYRATDDLGASATATVTVTIKPANSIEFTKTVWIAGLPTPCGITHTLRVPVSTTVAYCYTVHNSGIITLTHHILADDQLGTILAGQAYTLTPGATHTVIVTQTIAVTATNVATWTAATPRLADVEPVTATAIATVTLSTSTDDQDQDGIPDVIELVGDMDHDNLPNFLDPDADGDTILDQVEVGNNPLLPKDSNQDGVPDYLDPLMPFGKRFYLPLVTR